MRNLTVLFFLAAAITGCSTFDNMEKGLGAMLGKDEAVAFNVLGYPNNKQEYGTDTVYYWSNSSSGVLFVPQSTSTYGMVGNTSYYGTTSYNQAVPVNYTCEIQIVTGPFKTISNYQFNGNIGGCSNYSDRLYQYYKTQQPQEIRTPANIQPNRPRHWGITDCVKKCDAMKEDGFLKTSLEECRKVMCD